MAWNRPTLAQWVTRAESDAVAGFELENPVLRRAVVRVVARVIAGAAHMLSGHIAYLVDQVFPDRADRENLLRHAALYGERPHAAEFATGSFTATGANGSQIPRNTVWARADGVEYVTQEDATIADGEASIEVVAALPGVDANMPEGGTLRLASPLIGVDSDATVSPGAIAGGTEPEELEAFRARFILALNAEDLGGSDEDWIGWTLEIPGNTRAWVYRHEQGLGTVVIRFVRDGDAEIIPDGPTVAAVQAKLDAERPTTATPIALAPVADPVDFEIALADDTAETRAAVTAELEDLFYRVAEPGDGAGRGAVTLSEMRTAIGVAARVYSLVSPSADHIPALGAMPRLGTITWS